MNNEKDYTITILDKEYDIEYNDDIMSSEEYGEVLLELQDVIDSLNKQEAPLKIQAIKIGNKRTRVVIDLICGFNEYLETTYLMNKTNSIDYGKNKLKELNDMVNLLLDNYNTEGNTDETREAIGLEIGSIVEEINLIKSEFML